jgi:hypothetical protein
MDGSAAETARAKNRQLARKAHFMEAQFACAEKGIQIDSFERRLAA